MRDVDITVVVPTRNERNNIRPLIDRLSAVLAHRNAEVIFVDDSTDDTPEVVAEVAKTTTLPTLVMHRGPGERVGGLSGAVIAGLRLGEGRISVVMDGDLQHPPESIPELIEPIERGEVDLVVGSRYRQNGGLDGLSNRARVGFSWVATRLTKCVFPRRLQQVTDPMSGFYAVRSSAIDLDSLKPLGFKIMLETIARSELSVAEVGFRFAPRMSGSSKANLGEGIRFVGHLTRLRAGTILTARQRRATGFATVGASGLVVNTVAFWLILHFTHMPYLLAAALATQVSTTWNFAGMEILVFSDRRSGGFWPRYLKFCLLNNTVMLARLPLLAFLVSVLHCPKTLANIATLLLVFIIRFGVSDRYIYEEEEQQDEVLVAENAEKGGSGPVAMAVDASTRMPSPSGRSDRTTFRYYYDIHGIVTIGTDVVLPELAHFVRPGLSAKGEAPDIGIRVGSLGYPRLRARMVQSADGRIMRWEEHLGPLSANFAIQFDRQISVSTSRSLARSPHVLYTNVVEALLRFLFVQRGYMLLHAACMDIGGQGVMLSARTDTGKTGTVLKLLRSNKGSFLADDMTIIDSSGVARSFPKPLTISHHTLQSVEAGDLSRREWAWLKIQSRLHSKEGRGFALKLADHNVPIMTINSWTQRVVPPPKYQVQRLVPCKVSLSTRIEELYIIERGSPHHSVVAQSEAIDELLANTEDAYGFPPYRYLSQALSVDGVSYDELKERERLILISAMESVHIHRLGSHDFSWADQISEQVAVNVQPDLDFVSLDGITTANGSGLSNGVTGANGVTAANESPANGTAETEFVEVLHQQILPDGDVPPSTGTIDASSAPQ